MELEKIIKLLCKPILKNNSKEYLFSQIIPIDKKEIVSNILSAANSGKRAKWSNTNIAKDEFLTLQRKSIGGNLAEESIVFSFQTNISKIEKT